MLKQMDHSQYPDKIKKWSLEALHFTISDCRDCIAAMPDNENNGYYADEINYCGMEIYRRKGAKQ